jgi:uncharacterized RDD family membrane protein YckC
MDMDSNPYAPPESDLDPGASGTAPSFELAERGTRVVAFLLDHVLTVIPFLPFLALYLLDFSRKKLDISSYILAYRFDQYAGLLGLGFLALCCLVGYQWVLICKTGQTLGKKWTGIRIEKVDGRALGFVNGVILRNWIVKLVGSVQYLRLVVFLVDSLFIFRADRRCLHDHIAGTRVVRVR